MPSRRRSKFKFFHGTFIGPVMVKAPTHRSMNHQGICHLCDWSRYGSTAADARDMLLGHLDYNHFNPPGPYEMKAEDMPGYGAACNGYVDKKKSSN